MSSTKVREATDLIDVAPGNTPAETVQAAFGVVRKSEFSDLVEYLLLTVGPRITAAGAGLQDARQLAGWKRGVPPRQEVMVPRVEAMAEVAGAILAHYKPAVAASFLRSSQPALDDRAPLVMIREAADDTTMAEVMAEVRGAVRAFLEG